ncbi:hypothetical protein N825_34995 [Skermanella stibiiresistens SB22]|uniref:Uncharacterized protein n=1 Tax=Skermanella stibiiresistens SB22 TaxID=1385369 RepID=W9H7L0_9PROT|nr:hypothetical protein [Skermanella stibiiresistens]EWY40662.1 hypothetical protein N825_34995 [Skermanella stibiiresistens SB22]
MKKNATHFMVERVSPASLAGDVRDNRSSVPTPDPAELLAEARSKALAWVARGMPEQEIEYDPLAPRLTDKQLAQFEPVEVSFKQERL